MSQIPAAKILVIEDNASDVTLLKHALREHGVTAEMRVIADGYEAVQLALGDKSEEGLPDLIILDLNLPTCDGFAVLRAIRRSIWLSEARVVVLTTSESPSDRASAEELGILAYFTKPVELDLYLALGSEFRALLSAASAGCERAC